MSKRILITGGASGLGRALAERYAAAGDRVLIADRIQPTERLSGGVSYIHLDVRVPGDWQHALRWCENNWGGLDMLVNNAGVMAVGRVERLQADDWDWILDINLKGAAQGCRTLIPLFKRQGSGHIVNIASAAGLLNTPGMASYNASKAAVISLSETLRQELAPFGIRTTVICPGYVRTDLRTGLHSPDRQLAHHADQKIQSARPTAEQVAKQIVDAVSQERFLVLTHPEDRRALCMKRLLPRMADARAARRWRRMTAQIRAQDPQEQGKAA
ncbi:SDR family NAD(P)-dependent oxidoreductase [Streptomyces sp. NPDC088746]|uniref:SDR family NAD(P)-dependent oxidoreductase n=1 Tax=Streptomyces sp. NPDC088746 TaxID=3365885 RepID=UPI003823D9A4